MKNSFLNATTKLSQSNLFWLIIIEIIVFFGFLRVFTGFFQQDEWLSFGYRYLALKEGIIGIFKDAFFPSVGHYQPFNVVLMDILFAFFRVSYFPFAFISIFLHLIITALVYCLAKIIFGRNYLSVFAALVFGITASSFQATFWVLADLGVHFSTIFALLSLISFVNYLKNGNESNFFKSLLFLAISLFFKEIGIGLFLFYPLFLFLFKKDLLFKKRIIVTLILTFLLYFFLRVGMFFIPASYNKDTLIIKSQSAGDLGYNIFSFPFIGLSQSFFTAPFLVDISYGLSSFLLSYSQKTPDDLTYKVFVEKIVLGIVSTSISLIIIFFSLTIWYFKKKLVSSKYILFFLLFNLINLPIFAFAPERTGIITIVDSRNLYLISVGSSLLLFSILTSLKFAKSKKIIFLILPLIIFHYYFLDKFSNEFSENSQIRRDILKKISNQYAHLPKKVIFYAESDKSFYGLPEKERILPFQSGFGQTLLISYQQTENFPLDFFENRFLWEITDQGYEEYGGRGFGYFREFNNMGKVIKNNNLLDENIIAFSYDSATNKLTDITKQVQGRVQGYLAKKRILSIRNATISASANPGGASLAADGDKKTFWDSKLSYDNPQYFEIDLGDSYEIAQLDINSGENKDQNEVGYSVFLSSDKKTWEEVFYSKRHPPGNEGVVRLYFKPTNARFIKIEQKGSHFFASWVINELMVYEATD